MGLEPFDLILSMTVFFCSEGNHHYLISKGVDDFISQIPFDTLSLIRKIRVFITTLGLAKDKHQCIDTEVFRSDRDRSEALKLVDREGTLLVSVHQLVDFLVLLVLFEQHVLNYPIFSQTLISVQFSY